jgi:hypothetical protein
MGKMEARALHQGAPQPGMFGGVPPRTRVSLGQQHVTLKCCMQLSTCPLYVILLSLRRLCHVRTHAATLYTIWQQVALPGTDLQLNTHAPMHSSFVSSTSMLLPWPGLLMPVRLLTLPPPLSAHSHPHPSHHTGRPQQEAPGLQAQQDL